jgi:hypothetical protein
VGSVAENLPGLDLSPVRSLFLSTFVVSRVGTSRVIFAQGRVAPRDSRRNFGPLATRLRGSCVKSLPDASGRFYDFAAALLLCCASILLFHGDCVVPSASFDAELGLGRRIFLKRDAMVTD